MLLEALQEDNKGDWLEHLPQSVLSGDNAGQCDLMALADGARQLLNAFRDSRLMQHLPAATKLNFADFVRLG